MKFKFTTLFILAILFFGCAVNAGFSIRQKEKMLQNNLRKWENYRLDGIVEMNYKQFSFRKNIVVRKNITAFRFDIFDSGIMGLHPTPFISAYIDSIIVLRLPNQKETLKMEFSDEKKETAFFNFLKNYKAIFARKEQILKSGKAEIDGSVFYFSPEMEIVKIITADFTINFVYDNSQNPLRITLFSEKKKIAEIQIDKISYQKPEIEPLK